MPERFSKYRQLKINYWLDQMPKYFFFQNLMHEIIFLKISNYIRDLESRSQFVTFKTFFYRLK